MSMKFYPIIIKNNLPDGYQVWMDLAHNLTRLIALCKHGKKEHIVFQMHAELKSQM